MHDDFASLCLSCLQRTYIFTFLLSSRLFMHPYELMAKVCHLCMEHQRLSEPGTDKVRSLAKPVRSHFVNLTQNSLSLCQSRALLISGFATGLDILKTSHYQLWFAAWSCTRWSQREILPLNSTVQDQNPNKWKQSLLRHLFHFQNPSAL